MNKGVVFNIQRFCTDDGPGIRTTVFFKGCNLRCAWCHNPESQKETAEQMFYRDKCSGCGRCKDIAANDPLFVCFHDARRLCGREYTVDSLLLEILKDKIFYENSGGGVTFSGGECMLQIDFLEEILRECKKNGIHTAVDTAGYIAFEKFERIMACTDLFLYDVKCFDCDKHKRYTGEGNELILENLKKLLATDSSVWVRIPIIPTVNDSAEEMRNIKEFFVSYGHPEKVELLPYHAMGEHKYAALGKQAQRFFAPSEEKMTELKRIFS